MADHHKVEFVDQLGNRFMLDTSFEVVVNGEVGYIEENAHTSPGRMHVYFPERGHDRTLSLSDFESMSEAARHWVAGFLAGSEPGIYEYLGTNRLEEAPDPTPAEWSRWKEYTALFRKSGFAPWLNSRPVTPLEITDEELAELRVDGEFRPWSYAGERVWVPSGDTWVEADPQPELDEGELAGSICSVRGHPDLMQLASGWEICLDCAEVTAY
ncbi:MAG TPA: hypothetical protein VHW74_14595 [Mycobacteriales bacterium]|nr:hypothetical protein [Mycobacteriales bacterium]